jgi:hypothetical protein
MSDYVIGLSEDLWRPVVERSSGCRGWEFIDTPRDYVPSRGDRVVGFFGLAEVQLLQRLDVQVYAFTRGGVALPGAAQSLPPLAGIELSLLEPLRCAPPAAAGFEPGPAALLRATLRRQQREGPQQRARTPPAQASSPALPRPAQSAATSAPVADARGGPSLPSSAPKMPPVTPAEVWRAAGSAPRSRLAAAHFRRIHGAAAGLAPLAARAPARTAAA